MRSIALFNNRSFAGDFLMLALGFDDFLFTLSSLQAFKPVTSLSLLHQFALLHHFLSSQDLLRSVVKKRP